MHSTIFYFERIFGWSWCVWCLKSLNYLWKQKIMIQLRQPRQQLLVDTKKCRQVYWLIVISRNPFLKDASSHLTDCVSWLDKKINCCSTIRQHRPRMIVGNRHLNAKVVTLFDPMRGTPTWTLRTLHLVVFWALVGKEREKGRTLNIRGLPPRNSKRITHDVPITNNYVLVEKGTNLSTCMMHTRVWFELLIDPTMVWTSLNLLQQCVLQIMDRISWLVVFERTECFKFLTCADQGEKHLQF